MFVRYSQGAMLDEQPQWFFSGWRMRRVLGLLLVVSGLIGLGIKLSDPQTLPISKIKAQGVFHYVTEAMLQQTIDGTVNGGYFSVDVAQVRQTVERLPWVDHAAVRRIWPDTLVIQIKEQQPFARWGEEGLLNVRGELFSPHLNTFPEGLTLLQGPKAMQDSLVALYWQVRRDIEPLDLEVTRVTLDARRAVSVQLHNGLELVLGRQNKHTRLQRFVRAYPHVLSMQAKPIVRVDLRYTNGFSVQWKNSG